MPSENEMTSEADMRKRLKQMMADDPEIARRMEGKDPDRMSVEEMQAMMRRDAMKSAIKAVGDWEIDINTTPFNSRDSDGQWFDENTDVMPDAFQTPAIVYQHGIQQGAKGLQEKPIIIGRTVAGSLNKQADGWHIRVILDKTNEYAVKVWEAVKSGLAAVSSGTIDHLARLDIGGKLMPYRKNQPGRIAVWALGEVSLWEKGNGNLQPANRYAVALPAMKATYEIAGITFPDIEQPTTSGGEPVGNAEAAKAAQSKGKQTADKSIKENLNMDELDSKVQAAVDAALKAQAAEAQKKADEQKAVEVRAKEIADAAIEEYKKEAAKARRLPFDGQAPHQAQFAETSKYDNLTPGEMGLAVALMDSLPKVSVPQAALKALAIKLIEDKSNGADHGLSSEYPRGAMKAAGLPMDKDAYKAATDPMVTTGTTDGGNWVHTAYGRDIWNVIRAEANVVNKLPSQTIPDGYKSATIPLEGTDFTWYTVAQTSAANATTGIPDASVTASQITTPTNKEITVAKMGARGLYAAELTEDSILAFVPQARLQLITSGKEQLEHAVIDGDSTTTATTNINDIGNGSAVTAGSLFLMLDGLRKLALVTNTANSRAGGALDEDDYLETMWLMGTAGLAGADLSKCGFIIDPNVYKQSLKMASLKTKDVWANATMESGVLTKLWGYQITPSWFMHYKSTVRKANSAGKVDQTTAANNAYGAILGVRWDQWRFAYKRAMTIETTRFANSDSYEIVAWARVGLGYRDTEAAAITYGLNV